MYTADSTYQVNSPFPGVTNFEVPIWGSTITVCLGRKDDGSGTWTYSLWTCFQEVNEKLLAVDSITIPEDRVTAEQVARIAFLLEVDYKDAERI